MIKCLVIIDVFLVRLPIVYIEIFPSLLSVGSLPFMMRNTVRRWRKNDGASRSSYAASNATRRNRSKRSYIPNHPRSSRRRKRGRLTSECSRYTTLFFDSNPGVQGALSSRPKGDPCPATYFAGLFTFVKSHPCYTAYLPFINRQLSRFEWSVNSLEYCTESIGWLNLIQCIQNSAARLLTLILNLVTISHQSLRNLHWLTVRLRIVYKTLLLTYKCLHGLAPAYLQQLIRKYEPNRNLRSSSQSLLTCPSSSTRSYGQHAFSTAYQGR